MIAEPWGFDPADCADSLSLWHGRQDQAIPLRVAQAFASQLPGTDVTVVDGGHYSTLCGHFAAIVQRLTR